MSEATAIFALMFGGIVLHAFVARWIATSFVSEGAASVAGFAFAIGLGYSAVGRVDDGGLWQLGGSLGGVIGLALVWWLFFKRTKAHG